MKNKAPQLCVMGAGALWGLMSIYVHQLSAVGLTSMQISFVRAIITTAVMMGFLALTAPEKLKIRLRDIWLFIGTGFVSFSLFNWCYFTTIIESEASIAVMLLYTSPIFVMIISAILFKEAITLKKTAALAATFAGCLLVAGIVGGGFTISPKIFFIGLMSGFLYALYSIFGRFALKHYDPLTLTTYTFVFATLGTLFLSHPATIVTNLAAAPSSIFWCFAVAIGCTVMPYVLYTWGLNRMEPGKAAILATMEPLVGCIVGICLYSEPHNPSKIIGMLLIFAAVVILNTGSGSAEKEENMERIVAATGNKHKITEIEAITSQFGMKVITKAEAGVADLDPEENGTTFEENSLIKAEAIMKATGLPAVADDSGLMVDALDGAPGVYSARFSGEGATDESNNEKLLELMKDKAPEDMGAKFVSVVTICYPDGTVLAARGECPGHITLEPRGTNGFGYDPLFVPDGFDGRTYAELTAEEKNGISHRARALQKLKVMLEEK